MPKQHLEGKNQQERKAIRKQLGPLRALTVQAPTRARYDKALQKFFRFLESRGVDLPTRVGQMDVVVAEYIESLWEEGEGRSLASDTLAALQDTQPQLRNHLPACWRLLKTWHMNEIPARAPPMTLDVLEALVGWSIFTQRPLFALSLLIAFHGLLRTGELLGLKKQHFTVGKGSSPVLISLGLTKGGKRQGASESVTLHHADVVRRVRQWLQTPAAPDSLTSTPAQWRKTFNEGLDSLGFSSFQFRPYSLRRGGATFLFQRHGSLDKLLLHGRWQSSKTARLYINEGIAVLAELKLAWSSFSRTLRTQYLNSVSLALPSLEPVPNGRAGGVGRKRKQNTKKPNKVRKKEG